MSLIIEDGTGVTNANSYGSVADARAYAADRGVALSATDSDVETQLILATDYLESKSYVGAPVSYTQSLAWPRKQVMFDPDNPFPDNEIPPTLIEAQFQLCIEQFNGIVLQPSSSGSDDGVSGAVVEDRVDILTTRYSERIGTTHEPLMPKVDALLRGIIIVQPYLRSVRI